MDNKPLLKGHDPMSKLPTVQVVRGTAIVTINASDFDPEKHELADGSEIPTYDPVTEPDDTPADPVTEPDDTPADAVEDSAALIARLASEGEAQARVGLGSETLSPATETPETGSGAQMLVMKAGKRYKVCGADGKPIVGDAFQKSGYKDEAAAWAAIMATKS